MARKYYKQRRKWHRVPLSELGSEFAKLRITPELLRETEGMPWFARRDRISAITGIPFIDVNRALGSS